MTWILVLVIRTGSGVEMHSVPGFGYKKDCLEAGLAFSQLKGFGESFRYACLPQPAQTRGE